MFFPIVPCVRKNSVLFQGFQAMQLCSLLTALNALYYIDVAFTQLPHNILLSSCAVEGNDCLHCLSIALKSRNIHCILQSHKYPLNVTLFPLVTSKLVKNVLCICTQTFRSDALPPSLCDGIARRYNSESTCT